MSSWINIMNKILASQKIVRFRSREMFGSIHTSYVSGIFHAFVLGLIHKELQDPGQSPNHRGSLRKFEKIQVSSARSSGESSASPRSTKISNKLLKKARHSFAGVFFNTHFVCCFFTCPVWTWDAQRWNNRKYGWSNWSRSLALLFLVRVNTGDCRRCRSISRQGGMVLGCTHCTPMPTAC